MKFYFKQLNFSQNKEVFEKMREIIQNLLTICPKKIYVFVDNKHYYVFVKQKTKFNLVLAVNSVLEIVTLTLEKEEELEMEAQFHSDNLAEVIECILYFNPNYMRFLHKFIEREGIVYDDLDLETKSEIVVNVLGNFSDFEKKQISSFQTTDKAITEDIIFGVIDGYYRDYLESVPKKNKVLTIGDMYKSKQS